MDDAQLKKILDDMEVPPGDGNAKKDAIHLAVAAFKAHHQEKIQSPSQGFSPLTRLRDKSTTPRRREPMGATGRKKLIYGSMAAAAVVVLVVGISLMQLQHQALAPVTVPAGIPQEETSLSSPSEDGSIPAAASKALPRKEEFPPSSPSGFVSLTQDRLAARMPADEVVPGSTYQDVGRDQFEDFEANPVKQVSEDPVSTFSIDVDTASYSFVRRQLNHGLLPQKDAVRVEEMINYFDYHYPPPETKEEPFRAAVALTPSPWAEGKKLLYIGIKGYELQGEKPRSNLVFLLDVSGSMNSPDKLPLVKNSMKMLLDTLNPEDTIAIVVYAGSAGTVLEPTRVSERHKIYSAIEGLRPGGSTAGGAGIKLAYQLAEQSFNREAVNRVILATDGDFNVGITQRDELQDFVERKRERGIFLSVLGFGQGNYNDYMMQTLAQNGNGIAAYIDTLGEARKVLVEEASSTLFPIAKDVKIQLEFNPQRVAEYRLIGYETRHLKREDFNNDKVDAGDIGAGHTVTAIYEITPAGSKALAVDPLRYGPKQAPKDSLTDFSSEYAFLKIRYKLPHEDRSQLISTPVKESQGKMTPQAQADRHFAAAVAAFGQLLKGGQYLGDFSYDDVIVLAQKGKGEDKFGYRAEFIQLVRLAKSASAMQ